MFDLGFRPTLLGQRRPFLGQRSAQGQDIMGGSEPEPAGPPALFVHLSPQAQPALRGVSRMAPVVQHVGKLRRRDRDRPRLRRRPDEAPVLQPLGVERHPHAVVPEDRHRPKASVFMPRRMSVTPEASHTRTSRVRTRESASQLARPATRQGHPTSAMAGFRRHPVCPGVHVDKAHDSNADASPPPASDGEPEAPRSENASLSSEPRPSSHCTATRKQLENHRAPDKAALHRL